MEKIPSNEELKKIAETERKKKAVTLYLDYELVEETREFLGNKKSVSSFINDILEQISQIQKEKKTKEEQEKKGSDVKKEGEQSEEQK